MKRSAKEYDPQTGGKFSSISADFIERLIQVKWQGSTMAHYYQECCISYFYRQRLARGLRRRFEKHFGPISKPFPPDKEMFYSIMDEDEFIALARSFLVRIIESMVDNVQEYSHIIVDQLFSADNPEKDLIYFDDAKAIVVSRDPRDLYILSKTATGMDGRFIPSDNVEDYILYYKGIMKGNKAQTGDRVLAVRFEDAIYNAEETRSKIEKFLGLKREKPKNDLFSPERSINNTQLFIKYPQYREDVDLIEKKLSSYLYNYNDYDIKPTFSTKLF